MLFAIAVALFSHKRVERSFITISTPTYLTKGSASKGMGTPLFILCLHCTGKIKGLKQRVLATALPFFQEDEDERWALTWSPGSQPSSHPSRKSARQSLETVLEVQGWSLRCCSCVWLVNAFAFQMTKRSRNFQLQSCVRMLNPPHCQEVVTHQLYNLNNRYCRVILELVSVA